MFNLKNNYDLLEGQMSIWDLEIIQMTRKVAEEPKSFTKIDKKATENADLFIILEKYKSIENLSRIIKYCGGGIGIELIDTGGFKTIYVNGQGEEEFTVKKKLPVLPMDKILSCKEDLQPNELQEGKLKEVKFKFNVLKEIRRKGDENIILVLQDKVISINTEGWVLEFNNVEAAYAEDEVVKEKTVDIEAIRKSVKCGDIVEALIGKGKKVVQGRITRAYGLGDSILNIVYGNKHTAIGRYAIRKIIKCA